MARPATSSSACRGAGEFIALTLPSRTAVLAAPADIRIELRRGATRIAVSWPLRGRRSAEAAADLHARWGETRQGGAAAANGTTGGDVEGGRWVLPADGTRPGFDPPRVPRASRPGPTSPSRPGIGATNEADDSVKPLPRPVG